MPNTGNILSRTFSLFAAHWLPFLSISLLIHSPLIAFDFLRLVVGSTSNQLWISALSPLLFTPLVRAALVYGVFRSLRGQTVTTMGCVRGALSRWPAVVGLSLLLAVATSVGFLLCLVPGIIIVCGMFVAVPALLVEELPIIDAMKRSWSLTQGYKLPLFGVLLVLGIVGVGADTLLDKLSLPLLGEGFLDFLFSYLVNVPMTTLDAIAASVAYYEIILRRKEVDELELPSAFD